ncbi:MAG: Gfo/Idh/MocA family protein [Boseongicola sp.]
MPERLALVGAGAIGRRHLNAIGNSKTAELAAIVDPSPHARLLADESGVPHFEDTAQMLKAVAPTGVIVATPTEHHSAPALTALNHSCHVLIEKPIAATLADAQEIIELSNSTNKHVLVGHHRRYYPQVEKAREIVQSGALGKIVAVSGQWCLRKHDEYYEPDWRKKWQAGPVLTNLIHEMDYLRYILGPVDSVQAETSNEIQGFEKEDAAAILLRFASGALGTFVLSDQADSPWAWEFATGETRFYPCSGQNCIRFMGTNGALDFPNLQLWNSTEKTGNWYSPMAVEEFGLELGDAFTRQIDHFTDVIAGRAQPGVTAIDATQTLKATLAVLKAANTGTRVEL